MDLLDTFVFSTFIWYELERKNQKLQMKQAYLIDTECLRRTCSAADHCSHWRSFTVFSAIIWKWIRASTSGKSENKIKIIIRILETWVNSLAFLPGQSESNSSNYGLAITLWTRRRRPRRPSSIVFLKICPIIYCFICKFFVASIGKKDGPCRASFEFNWLKW